MPYIKINCFFHEESNYIVFNQIKREINYAEKKRGTPEPLKTIGTGTGGNFFQNLRWTCDTSF